MTIDLAAIVLIFTPIIFAIIIFIANSKWVSFSIFINQAIVTIAYVYTLKEYFKDSSPILINMGGWNPLISVGLKIDGTTLVFMLMALIIWWTMTIYIWNDKKEDFKFLFFILFLQGAYHAFVMCNDFFTFFILIELITILSSILIIYKKDGHSIKSGLYYLMFNSVGMVFYLLGLILFYIQVGTLNMSIASEVIKNIKSPELVLLPIGFFISAFSVKSAIFPVYDWLPRAHGAAQACISALLSGLLVKCGLYGLIRLGQVVSFGNFQPILFYIGFLTALSGVIFAISQKDIKLILAFHTISQVGIIVMGLFSGSEIGYYGGVSHLFNHFLFKSLLFLAVGVIINICGERRVTKIRGIAKTFPLLTVFMAVGVLSITGAPFFNGFLSKTLIKTGVKYSVMLPSSATWLMRILNLGTIISFIKFSQIFMGKKLRDIRIPKSKIFGVGLIAAICIASGVLEMNLMPAISSSLGDYANVFSWSGLLEYVMTVMIGYLTYNLFIKKDLAIMFKIRHISIDFETANIMLLFYVVMITMGVYVVGLS
jgi:multicomponent Na+:H+ antiporter subunit D